MSRLLDLLGNVRVQFGLRQQGHLPRIAHGIRSGESWADIAKAVRWDEATLRDHVAMLLEDADGDA